MISFFSGVSIILLANIVYTILMPNDSGFAVDWEPILNEFPAYRFMLMLIFSLFLASIAILVWKKYRVNYVFILNMDFTYKIN